jgi:hypothetical protein
MALVAAGQAARSPTTADPRPLADDLVARACKPAVLAAFACWVLIVGAHHEPWVDEAQAWLLARDNDLGDLLFARVRYEGSPGLWHALLWLCIHAGLPFERLYLVSATCAIAGAAIMLWRAPFPLILRVALITSYFPAYQYAIVARSYALDLCLVPALAALFARRLERPVSYAALIGVLANCNAHSFVAAAVLGCEFALAVVRAGTWRTWQVAAALSLATGLGLFAVLCAWQPADNVFLSLNNMPPFIKAVVLVTESFIDRLSVWDAQPPAQLNPALSFIVLAPSVRLFVRAKSMALSAALLMAPVGFSLWKYGNAWQSGLLFLFWVFLLWTSWPALSARPMLKRVVVGSVGVLCALQTVEAVRSGLWDIAHPYSAAQRAADIVIDWRGSHPDGKIAGFGYKTFALQPYFPSNIFANYHAGAAASSYITWKKNDAWTPYPTTRDWQLLSMAGFGLIILAPSGLLPAELKDRQTFLRRTGYDLLASLPGHMQWKGYEREDDSLLIFAKR